MIFIHQVFNYHKKVILIFPKFIKFWNSTSIILYFGFLDYIKGIFIKNNKMYSDLVYFVTLCGIRFSIYKFAVYELNIGLKLAFMVSESPQKVRDNKA